MISRSRGLLRFEARISDVVGYANLVRSFACEMQRGWIRHTASVPAFISPKLGRFFGQREIISIIAVNSIYRRSRTSFLALKNRVRRRDR